MPFGDAPLSAKRSTALSAAVLFSFALHGLLYFGLQAQRPRLPRLEMTSSALFGATFEIETVPPSAEAAGERPSTVPGESTHAADAMPVPEQEDAPAHEPGSKAPARLVKASASEPPQAPGRPPTRRGPNAPDDAHGSGAPAREGASAPARASAPSGQSTAAGRSASEPEASSGAYGQEGIARARASLFSAFVRTLPLAGKLLPAWLEAPLDQKQKVLVELRVDAGGRLHEIEIVRGDTKSVLARTALKNEAFLGRGTFSIQGEREGQMLIELSSEIEQRSPSEEEDAGSKVVSLGQRIPDSAPGQAPTGAYFTYGNGRHIELRASIVDVPR